jgi:dihydropteroate synthase
MTVGADAAPPGAAGGRRGPLGFPALNRCVVMGVLNITPDSFSDGGRYTSLAAAVAHGLSIRDAGADLVDVGGESTRPGADRVDAAEEAARVLPAIRELAAAGVPVSVDTTRASVAAAAIDAGAVVVNDVSGGLADPDMAKVVAAAEVPWVLMHWRGHSRDMQQLASYRNVVGDVVGELSERVDAAVAAGVDPRRLVLDPGLGFAKTAAHNWALLAQLQALHALGLPVLVAASRKSFLGRLLAGPDGVPRPVDDREHATLAVTVIAALAGVWGIRVHEVQPSIDALRVVTAYTDAARAAATTATRPDTAVGRAAGPPRLDTGGGSAEGVGVDTGGGRAEGVGVDTGGGRAERLGKSIAGGGAGARDRVTLTGLRVTGRHGVFAHERRDGQEFVVDATLELDTAPAAHTDELADTVDYGGLAQQLAAEVAGEPVNLIETLAGRLAEVCLRDPRVTAAEVTVHKPAAPIPLPFADVAVTVRRSRA